MNRTIHLILALDHATGAFELTGHDGRSPGDATTLAFAREAAAAAAREWGCVATETPHGLRCDGLLDRGAAVAAVGAAATTLAFHGYNVLVVSLADEEMRRIRLEELRDAS